MSRGDEYITQKTYSYVKTFQPYTIESALFNLSIIFIILDPFLSFIFVGCYNLEDRQVVINLFRQNFLVEKKENQ